MKKTILVSLVALLVLALAIPAAALKFKDVPDSHWAKDYVYDLVNRGVTTGYPDGTFRGNKKISRYETAVFISKLAKSISGGGVSEDRLRELIRSELAKSSAGKAEGWMIGGTYTLRGLLNKIIGDGNRSVSPTDRIQLKIAKDLGPDLGFELGMDTRTSALGYPTWGNYDVFAAGTIDLAARASVDDILGIPLEINVTQGLGDAFHREDKVQVTTDVYGVTVGGAYEFNSGVNNAAVNASNQYTILAAYSMDLPLLGATSAMGSFDMYAPATGFNPLSSAANKAVNLEATMIPDDGIKLAGKIGINGSTSNGLMLAGMLTLDDYFNTGTTIYGEAYKLGNVWQTSLGEDFAGVDVFNNLINGTSVAYIGGQLDQVINDKWSFIGRLALNFSGGGLGTLQTTIIEPKLTLASSEILESYAAYRYTMNNVTSGKTDRIEVGSKVSF